MAFEKKLSGEISQWDLNTKGFSISTKRWEAGKLKDEAVAFSMDPDAKIMDERSRPLKLADLKIGQRVTVHYITEQGGRNVAKSITVVQPLAPTATQATPSQGAPAAAKPAATPAGQPAIKPIPKSFGPQPSPKPA
ncbi:MAG: hypothetical protein NC819_01905 [Candidatus Omnitrophica bacterium]|nr:hypothetical protein [Candidatus Omnitrophota bacterium]